MTAPACFELLASGHLDRVATGPDDPIAYFATEPNVEQRELLKRLRLLDLLDPEQMTSRIEPRPAV